MPGSLHAAERQLDPATRTVVIDEDLPAAYRSGQTKLPGAVSGPDASHEAIGRSIRDVHRLHLADKRDDDLHGTEYLLLGEPVLGAKPGDQGRPNVVTLMRRVGQDLALRA